MFPDLTRFKHVAVDVETTGLQWYAGDKVFGVAIACPDGTDYYYDIRRQPEALEWLRDQVPRVKVVNHHLKFDIHMLRGVGVKVDPAIGKCTMIQACLIDEHLMSYSLDDLAKKYLGRRKDSDIYEAMAASMGGEATRKAQIARLSEAPVEVVAKYAKLDARLALDLYEWQMAEIERQDLHQVLDLESRLFPIVVEMESHGVRVNLERAHKAMYELTREAEKLQQDLNRIAGFPVNPNPSQSIHKLFKPEKRDGIWYACDGTPLNETEAGKPSLGKDALTSMVHPAAPVILKLRTMLKCRDTFLKGHVIGHAHNGRVYPNINQTKGDSGEGGELAGTSTGRFSYTEPALQQIPSRNKEVAAIVRPVFLPDEGQGWSYGDLDQHEYRIFAHYVSDPTMLDMYQRNPDLDVHAMVAEITGLPRNAPASGGANAKQMNLGMVFCMGAGALAKHMKLPYTVEKVKFKGDDQERDLERPGPEAMAIFEKYHGMIPGVKDMQRKAASIAKSRGYVRTLFGRHIRFPRGQYTHKASGLIYQGTSADLNKDNLIRVAAIAKEFGGRVLLNIHDEYSLSLPMDAERALVECQKAIQNRPELRVPIRIDFSKLADNWWNATKAEKAT